MTMANINIYTDGELVAKAQSVLTDLGLDMSTAINAFLTQVVDKETLPFVVDKPQTANRGEPKWNCMKGEVWMADAMPNLEGDAPMEEPVKSVRKPRKPGCWSGKIRMAEDFDAPMEEFAEYI
jgi:addiction module RelB/DinJ family antitoxin